MPALSTPPGFFYIICMQLLLILPAGEQAVPKEEVDVTMTEALKEIEEVTRRGAVENSSAASLEARKSIETIDGFDYSPVADECKRPVISIAITEDREEVRLGYKFYLYKRSNHEESFCAVKINHKNLVQ